MTLRAEYRPFHEPWHAQIFALTVHLNEQGHFDWKDWSKVLVMLYPQKDLKI